MMNRQDHRAYLYLLRLLGVLLVLLGCICLPGHAANEHETDILISVDPYKLPEGLTLIGPPLKEIEVRVQGALAAWSILRSINQGIAWTYPVLP